MKYDKIIIGAGLYGLYSALYCAHKGENVLVLEYEDAPFKRATYINQARIHMGYHYPRSFSTATKSAGYFDRFNLDFKECINSDFKKIYAISSNFSWTNAAQFNKFCSDSNIFCESISTQNFFRDELCEEAFLTKEYTYDAKLLLTKLNNTIENFDNISILYNTRITDIIKTQTEYSLRLDDGRLISSSFILNTTYASINQILHKLKFPLFNIKYEICEIILCKVASKYRDVGITIMDGPFFSIMPFGKTGLHSLTSVTFTPHLTSYNELPTFDCQSKSEGFCSPYQLGNCNECTVKPKTAWNYMSALAKKYLKEDFDLEYQESLFSMKPILNTSEIDDSRPTVVKQFSERPTFVSVLSGKINTIYDLEELL